jgi:hypothetical protein
MHQHGPLPRARQDDLLVEAVGEELLLYDQNRHVAHCLSPTAGCVWLHCDGERDVTELAVLAEASEDLVADALHELRERDLLHPESQLTQSALPGESRREAISRITRVGAAATSVPLIVSATAATPAMAGSMELISCSKSATETCCICETAAGGEACSDDTEEDCKKVCSEGKKKFKSWTPEAKCL